MPDWYDLLIEHAGKPICRELMGKMMAKKTYSVICQSIVGSTAVGFRTIYVMNGRRFGTRQAAIDYGFTLGRSDDFNIGVWENRDLISIDWMDKPVETDAALLRKIQEHGELAI